MSALSGTSQSLDTFCPLNRHAVSVENLLNASMALKQTFSCVDCSTFTCEREEAGPSGVCHHSAVKPSNRPLFVSSSLLSHLNEYFLAIHFMSSHVDCLLGVCFGVELHKSGALCLALSVTEELRHLHIQFLLPKELGQNRVGGVLIQVSYVDRRGLSASATGLRSLVRLSRALLLVEGALTLRLSSRRSRRTTSTGSSLEATIVVVVCGGRVVGILGSGEGAALVISRRFIVASTSASSLTSSAVGEASASVSASTGELGWASGSSSVATWGRGHASRVRVGVGVVVVVLGSEITLRGSLSLGFRSAPSRRAVVEVTAARVGVVALVASVVSSEAIVVVATAASTVSSGATTTSSLVITAAAVAATTIVVVVAAATSASLVATATTTALVATASVEAATTVVVVEAAAAPHSPGIAAVIFSKLGEVRASLNDEIDSLSVTLLQEVEVLHEAVEFVFVDIKDSSHASLNSTHLADLLSHSRFPVFAQNTVARGSVQGLALGVSHLDGQLVLLSSDQTTSSKSLLVVPRNVGEGHAEGFVGVSLLLDQLGRGLSEERKDGVVDLFEVLKNLFGGRSDDILRLGNSNTSQLNSSLALDVFH